MSLSETATATTKGFAAPVVRDRAAASRVWIGLVAVCLAAIVVASVQFFNEAYISMHGDMPRYLMNGVFLFDLLRDRPFGSLDSLMEYTQLYYARYPALSLGHHPPLVSAAEVPMFGIFGVSIWSGRIVSLISLVASVAFLYLLVQEMYGAFVAFVAATLFVTCQIVVELSQAVMSETPALALLLIAAYCLHRFCITQRRWALTGFVVAATLSLYAKQLAIFAFPAYLALAISSLGWRRLLRRDVLSAMAVLFALTLPLLLVSISLSPASMTAVALSASNVLQRPDNIVGLALRPQLAPPVLWLAVLGMLLAVVRRDHRAVLFVALIACVLVGLLMAGQLDPARHSVYWVPALSVMAGSVAIGWRTRWVARVAMIGVLVATALQVRDVRNVKLAGAQGYEEAARFVLQSNPGPTVLFSGDVDTGFFTFFIRKHDADRRLVVLRSDKLLTTSFLGRLAFEKLITRSSDVYPILQRFGTRYVVIEDRPSRAPVLEGLRQELQSSRFVERARIPIVSRDPRLRGTSLAVYEFTDSTPPAEDAVLSMNLPIVRRSLAVKLPDLIERKYLR